MYHLQSFDFPADIPLEKTLLAYIAKELLKSTEIPQSGTINLAIVPDERMQELNRTYRTIDKNTDVLSFHYFEPGKSLKSDEIFGEILFSESKIREQATTFWHTPVEEAYRLIVHGLLHLQGFDHETEEDYEQMWQHEQTILRALQKEFGILMTEV